MNRFATFMNKRRGVAPRGASPGFTLTELMVVIALIAILLTAATPAMISYLRQRGVREAADQLYADMQRAKLLAISRGADCVITVDTANNNYRISLTNQVIDLNVYRGGVIFTNNPVATAAEITFNPRGLCNPPGGSIVLTNADGIATVELRASLAGGISQRFH